MPDIWMDVDTALSEVPVNLLPLIDDTDFKTIEDAVAWNAAGMDLTWNFSTTGGAFSSTAVTPTTGGDYDWAEHTADDGMYTIEIPASGGASINNDTEGFGWFTGVATGVLPWRGPIIGFRAAALNNSLIDGAGLNDLSAAEVNAECDTALTDYAGPTKAEMDTAHALLATPAEVNTECDTALTDYAGPTKAEMDTAHALLATPAEVNAEMVDALATDTYAEPGQEAPGATVSLSTKIGYLYKFLRNKITNDGSTTKVYNDAKDTVDQKATTSEGAGTVTRDEFETGP